MKVEVGTGVWVLVTVGVIVERTVSVGVEVEAAALTISVQAIPAQPVAVQIVLSGAHPVA